MPSGTPSARKTERIRLLWLSLDNISFREAVDEIVRLCKAGVPRYIVTPNVDHFMKTRTNEHLRSVYANAALSLADGVPVVWAARLLGQPLKEKVSGSDLLPELCGQATEMGLRVFLIGGAPGVAERARDRLKERHPGLQVVGVRSPQISADGSDPQIDETLKHIRETAPNLVFVAFGNPKQELWMARYHRDVGAAVCIGVGGSLDFIASAQRRAPQWMQRTGLEWLWRLACEPRRLWKRYLVDDLPFLWFVAWEYVSVRLLRRDTSR